MRSPEADKFFRALAKRLDEPAIVYLTGAVAGAIFGKVRSSADIDFAIEPKRKGEKSWRKINDALLETSDEVCVTVQYARDIDRWGMISLLDYRRTAIPYRKFGSIDVRTLDPVYWSIGKLTRCLDQDVQDLLTVLKKKKVAPARLVKTLGKALRQSPPSTQRFQFRQHVEEFLEKHGRKVWGAKFDPAISIRTFHKQAGISLRAVK